MALNESFFTEHHGTKSPKRRKRREMNPYHPLYGKEAEYYDNPLRDD